MYEHDTPNEEKDALLRAEQRRKADERLEELLMDGLNSGPATPMTSEDWDNLRRQTREHAAERSAKNRAA